MLISFEVKNFLSFKDKVRFSMEKTPEKQKKERLPYIEEYDINLLPVVSIYGGNASGKSNLIKSLRFAQSLIVRGTQIDELIPVEPFLLDDNALQSPSEFSFVILIKNKIYEYGFKVSKSRIEEEYLIEILKTTEAEVFRRDNKNSVNLTGKLPDRDRLKVIAEGTRNTQLFLTNTVTQNHPLFRDIYYWFRNQLVIIDPHAKYQAYNEFTAENAPMKELVNRALNGLDTGITKLGEENIPVEAVQIPPELKDQIERLPIINIELPNGERYIIYNLPNESIRAAKIVSFHSDGKGREKKFDFVKESDGTRRVIDLLPAFIESSQKNYGRVFVIDELDRSLHSTLVKRLLQAYLSSCGTKSRSQIIFTTHDLMLMDQNLLRRDEMWIMERDSNESSRLYSISDYKDVRKDKDLRRSYLQGRFGGVPRILLQDSFGLENLWDDETENEKK